MIFVEQSFIFFWIWPSKHDSNIEYVYSSLLCASYTFPYLLNKLLIHFLPFFDFLQYYLLRFARTLIVYSIVYHFEEINKLMQKLAFTFIHSLTHTFVRLNIAYFFHINYLHIIIINQFSIISVLKKANYWSNYARITKTLKFNCFRKNGRFEN